MRTLHAALALLLAASGSALAQSATTPSQPGQSAVKPQQSQAQQNPSQQSPQQQTQQQSSNQPIRQQVQQVMRDLQGAGYTDVKIMTDSFLVRAKDKNGNPVMMVLNPDSVTAITEERSSGANQTVGSGSSNNAKPGSSPNAPAGSSK